MERIFISGHGTPKNLKTGDGTEFFNSKYKVIIIQPSVLYKCRDLTLFNLQYTINVEN